MKQADNGVRIEQVTHRVDSEKIAAQMYLLRTMQCGEFKNLSAKKQRSKLCTDSNGRRNIS